MSLNLDIDTLPPEKVEAAITRLEAMKAQRAAEKKYGTVSTAPPEELPPKGPPCVKGSRLRGSVENALTAVANGESGTGWRQRTQEMFVPLVHPPGHAQADFGEAIGIDRRERGDVLSVAPGVLVRYRLNDYSVPTT